MTLLFETDEIDEFSVEDNLWLSAYARQYTQSQMVSGEILSERINWDCNEEQCEMVAAYDCHEMIGRVKYEEIIGQDAKDN